MRMTLDELLERLPARRGHIVLESGYHMDTWLTLEALFVSPREIALLVGALLVLGVALEHSSRRFKLTPTAIGALHRSAGCRAYGAGTNPRLASQPAADNPLPKWQLTRAG